MKLKPRDIFILITMIIVLGGIIIYGLKYSKANSTLGEKVDSLNGVSVYYNGAMNNVSGRNTTADGYNLGLKYQCVEFVKRYYYEHYKHRMPDSYGHAKSFFNPNIKDGNKNKQRDLIQYSNPSISRPEVGDLVVYSGNLFNKYGHVSIISKVSNNTIEVIQQNVGTTTRTSFPLKQQGNMWNIDNQRILGWLRKQ
ncbi:CHAP domain-containing protein [Formosa sp. 3Alg 14/1]|uniref:CHAP domain-containing protein n=1 Tax=Formosa sp. 3Alg 14/1 TaxID=3382190 RepID=UPI0039BE9754